MNISFWIALRYLKSKRRTGFISLVTYISVGGVMIGTAALVITLSVMNGFETEVRERIIGADAHIRLTQFHGEPILPWKQLMDKVRATPEVVGVSPFVLGKGMLRKKTQVDGVVIKGIQASTVGEVSDLPRTIILGSLFEDELPSSALYSSESEHKPNEPRTKGFLPGIVIGKQLGMRMGLQIGDTLVLISPLGMEASWSLPQMGKFVVSGIFETGLYEYDEAFVYIPLEAAQRLFEYGSGVTGLEIKLRRFYQADQIAKSLEDSLHYPYYARTWWDMHRTLFRWMKIEKWLYTLLLSLIILVAAFNIISSQIMMVLEKKREIGILKAIGANRKMISGIFLFEGLIIGGVGSISGLVVGWALCRAQQVYKFFSLPGDVYFLSSLPVKMEVLDFVIITVLAMFLTLSATLYPAQRAALLDPVEVIRYE